MPPLILIADDYEDNLELLRLILVTAGYEVLEARDGQECVELACSRLPDLIMVDLSMPKLDGWAVFNILSADHRTREIPCVAVTAYAEMDRLQARNASFSGYLSKPFQSTKLLDKVARLLSRRAIELTVVEPSEV
jgi:two-component system cell cycle response regulator DivK